MLQEQGPQLEKWSVRPTFISTCKMLLEIMMQHDEVLTFIMYYDHAVSFRIDSRHMQGEGAG